MSADAKLPLSVPKIVDKPWGREEWLFVGTRVVMKRLVVNAGARLSLQVHRQKEEGWLLVRGRARVRFNESEGEMVAGDVLHLPTGTVHRIEAIEDVELLEASTHELTDVVRIEDDFGRN